MEEQGKKAAEARAQVQLPMPTAVPVKVAGTKTNRIPKYTIKDFKAMPDDFKLPDEKTILASIKSKKWGDGTEAPAWLEVKWEDDISSNGRKK